MLGLLKNSPLQLSKPLFAILITTILLAILLATSAVRNLRREQELMESFLLDEGLTLIRSFEAGARTTMRHQMNRDLEPLRTLVRETAATRRIAYIAIVTDEGSMIAREGRHDINTDRQQANEVLKKNTSITRMIDRDGEEPIFEVTSVFHILTPSREGHKHHMRWACTPESSKLEQGQAVIHLGLRAGEFIQARNQDISHTLFMGGLLLLTGSAGFYFLFVYHGMQVSRSTLAAMKLYTKNIISSMPDGLITLDAKGTITSVNPRLRAFTGMEQNQFAGKCPRELFPGWPDSSTLERDGNSAFSYTFKRPDGSEVPVEVSVSPLRDEDGNPMGTVFLLRDLRMVRALEQQLARSRRLASLGRMAAAIAHEIRNPLGTLRGFAQYFGARAQSQEGRQYSELMVTEVDRLNESISSLLQFSRPRPPEFALISPKELLEKCSLLLEHDFKEKHLTLTWSASCSDPIEADADLLLQVLFNLLKNALHASKPNQTVDLSCIQDETWTRITITDRGSGMSEEEKEQMFDPFFSSRKGGTGLGLAVSHQIIEQHNGSFEVKSQPGRGTSITVILPRAQNRTTRQMS
jgi:two-component system sensor histidine kinase HydH